MKLSTYLEAHGLTDSAFARRIKTAPSTVMRLKRGDRMPSMSLAMRIHAATDGSVTPNDFAEPAP